MKDVLSSSDKRFDAFGELSSPEIQPDGSVIFSGRIARTGDHIYSWGVEYRDAAELSRIVTQLAGVPVTASHPVSLISSGGKADQVGKVVSARIDGDHIIGRLQLNNIGASLVRAGIKQISLGYATIPVNGKQTNTRADHVALVMTGRCGPTCEVRADHCCGESHSSLGVQVVNQLGAMRLMRR